MYTPTAVVEGPYLKDLQEQPAALRRTLRALPDVASVRSAVQAVTQGKRPERILLTGMGSSLHALCPLYIRLSRAGYFVQVLETSELLYYYRESLTPGTLTVAVSQSGESAEIVRLLDGNTLRGPCIGVTNSAGSTLASASDYALITSAGSESTVSCKTYLAGLAALHLLGIGMTTDGVDDGLSALEAATDAVESYLERWQDHVDWFASRISGVQRFFVTGRGWSMATAGTGGLILKESTRTAAEGMSSAAFRHGPLESVGPDSLACICEGDAVSAALNRRLYADVLSAGGKAVLVGADAMPAALRVSTDEPSLLPLVEILPVQMLSLAIAALRGTEAGQFRVATKITTVE